jgi:CS domain
MVVWNMLSVTGSLFLAAVISRYFASPKLSKFFYPVDWVLSQILFLLQFMSRNTIGRILAYPSAKPKETFKFIKFRGVSKDTLYGDWEEIDNAKYPWHLISYEIQFKEVSSSQEFHTGYKGTESDCLIDDDKAKIRERTQYLIRGRYFIGSTASEWVEYSEPIWSLSERNHQNGSIGPILDITGKGKLPSKEYSWGQRGDEIFLNILLEGMVDGKLVIIKRQQINVIFKKQELIVKVDDVICLEGKLCYEVNPDDSFWELIDVNGKKGLEITLAKIDRLKNWESVIIGHPPIELF